MKRNDHTVAPTVNADCLYSKFVESKKKRRNIYHISFVVIFDLIER